MPCVRHGIRHPRRLAEQHSARIDGGYPSLVHRHSFTNHHGRRQTSFSGSRQTFTMARPQQHGRAPHVPSFMFLILLVLQAIASASAGAGAGVSARDSHESMSLNDRFPLLLIRQAPSNYEDQVCHPPVNSPTDIVPPCSHIETIETLCTPNGTEPLYLAAHAQCMCQGSFFLEWEACLSCLFVHGLRSERDVAFYKSVLGVASSSLCAAPTPTTSFAAIFTSVLNASPPIVTPPTTGDTVSSDLFPSRTEVSLYFTPTTSLGPGRITGDAARATASGLVMAPPGAPNPTASGGSPGSGSGRGSGTSSGQGPSSTPSAAVGRAGWMGRHRGMMAWAALLALVFVL